MTRAVKISESHLRRIVRGIINETKARPGRGMPDKYGISHYHDLSSSEQGEDYDVQMPHGDTQMSHEGEKCAQCGVESAYEGMLDAETGLCPVCQIDQTQGSFEINTDPYNY